MNKVIVNCENISKNYTDNTVVVQVLKDINLTISSGERIAITGPSGSGKSTLLHLLGGLDNPTAGRVSLKDNDWQLLNEKKRCKLRNSELGFIYQFHHLLPEFSALENVAMPLLLANLSGKEALKKAQEILDKVGLNGRLNHKPSQLSGGERQRVAIARALVHQPSCVLADEPTGNLDHNTAQKVFELMDELNRALNTALIIVTHDRQLANKMDTILTIDKGVLVKAC